MKSLLPLVVFALGMASATAQEQPEPAARYQELLRAYSAASGAFRPAETDRQRNEAVERTAAFAQRFVELANQHRDDPVALLALRQAVQAVNTTDSLTQQAWEMNREAFPVGMPSEAAKRIVDVLLRDHLPSDQLAPICDRMRYCIRPEFERFLSEASRSNPHRNVQAMTSLVLAQLLRNQLYVVDRVSARPEWITRYEAILGREYFESIRGRGRAALVARLETLYERAAKFDDVKNFPYSETIAQKAARELFDIRHLSVGKTAPDIEGEDQDGRPFKLSDYRGKVVLLYFWLEY